jgi:hypothetical protein
MRKNITLPKTLDLQVKELALKEGITQSQVITLAITYYLESLRR